MRLNKVRSLSAITMALLASAAIPSAVLAYNGWDMQTDQRTVGDLAQEGVISPGQAQLWDNRASAKAYNSGMFGGLFGRTTAMNPAGAYQSSGQIHHESRELDRLERDGIISGRQDRNMKQELWNAHNAAENGLIPGAGYVPGMVAQPAYVPGMTMAPVMANQVIEPNPNSEECRHAAWMAEHGLVTPASYAQPNYYTTSASGTILNRVGNYFRQ